MFDMRQGQMGVDFTTQPTPERKIEMNVDGHFAVPLGWGYNVELAQKYLPIVEELLKDPRTCNPDFFPRGRTTHGIPDFDLVNMPEFQEMKEWVYELGCKFLEKQGFHRRGLKNNVFLLANALDQGGYHKSHTHYDCAFSGVLYLTAPEGTSALEFEDPVTERLLQKYPVEDYNNPYTWDYIYSKPDVGLYNIFPLWFRHMVLENPTPEPRIAIAFNVG
jgi:uncharacterized protein (TIGR02466 family)